MKWLRRCSTKRTLLVLGLFIVGGAIINVAVAWALVFPRSIALKHDRESIWTQDGHLHLADTFQSFGQRLVLSEDSGPTNDSNKRFNQSGTGPNDVDISWLPIWCISLQPEQWPSDLDNWMIVDEAAGYPYLSMRSRSIGREHLYGVTLLRAEYGIVLKGERTSNFDTTWQRHILPLQPIWPGFASNTIFYAAILGMMFTAPGFVRRRIRGWRRRCTGCGYDLRGQVAGKSGNMRCPECGANSYSGTKP